MRKQQYCTASKEHINKYKMAHCVSVAEYMRKHAYKYGLDADEMYVVGLLHDVGYLCGRINHEQVGSDILTRIGIKPDIAYAVCKHGTSPYKVEQGLQQDLLQVCPVLVLLYEADMAVDAQGFCVGFDRRLQDIGKRYGYDSIAYKTAHETVEYVRNKQRQLNC